MPIKVKRAIHHLPYNGYTYVLDFQIKPEITKCQFFFMICQKYILKPEFLLKVFSKFSINILRNILQIANIGRKAPCTLFNPFEIPYLSSSRFLRIYQIHLLSWSTWLFFTLIVLLLTHFCYTLKLWAVWKSSRAPYTRKAAAHLLSLAFFPKGLGNAPVPSRVVMAQHVQERSFQLKP